MSFQISGLTQRAENLQDASIMVDPTRGADVIDFFWEWQKRRSRNGLAELALDKCAETYKRRDWDGFAYWHRIYCRQRTMHWSYFNNN